MWGTCCQVQVSESVVMRNLIQRGKCGWQEADATCHHSQVIELTCGLVKVCELTTCRRSSFWRKQCTLRTQGGRWRWKLGGGEGVEAWRLMVPERRNNICGAQQEPQWAGGKLEVELPLKREMNTDLPLRCRAVLGWMSAYVEMKNPVVTGSGGI